MAHKDLEARNAYMRAYKAARRLDPEYKSRELEKERARYEETKEATRQGRIEKNARYREKNREKLAAAERERNDAARLSNPEAFAAKLRKRSTEWRAAHCNDEKVKQANRDNAMRSYAKKKDCPEFKKQNVERAAAWQKKNYKREREKARARRVERYNTDINFKIGICLRRRLYMAVKNNHRSGIAVRELGCSIDELKTHLESRFTNGMTWDNWGLKGWHIDHIMPISSYDLSSEDQVKAACHFTNLQPLWASDNIRKGSKIE